MKQAIIKKLLLDKIRQNEVCLNCIEQNGMITSALTPYIISDNSTLAKNRIMFIGKVARGDSLGGECYGDFLEDVTAFGKEYLTNSSWAYYRYTKEIIENYYGSLDRALHNT